MDEPAQLGKPAQCNTDLRGDIESFHAHWRGVCDGHSAGLYEEYKAWCDRHVSVAALEPCKPARARAGMLLQGPAAGSRSQRLFTPTSSGCSEACKAATAALRSCLAPLCCADPQSDRPSTQQGIVLYRYFYIPCRKEHRGTGGIFFDDLAVQSSGFDAVQFTKDVGDNILPSWLPTAQARADARFDAAQRDWQELRRGRYVEFNLLYDRGVKFGLAGGRIESIMVSAPPRVQWQYMRSVEPAAGSPEAEMLEVLRQPVQWAPAAATAAA